MREAWGVDDKQVIAVVGDLAKPNLGVAAADLRKLKGKIDHFFHLAAIYDLQASAEDAAGRQRRRHAPRRRVRDGSRRGLLPPRELDRGGRPLRRRVPRGHVRGGRGARPSVLPRPSTTPKASCAANASGRFASTGPGFVVGDSKTGHIDKIDGPYYFFKTIQKMREILPPWMPTIGIEGGRINIVPGRFRRRRARLPRAQEGPRRQVLPPDRSRAAPDRRSAEHLRAGRARAADDDARQREDVRLHPGADPVRTRLARAGQARDARRAERPRHSARRVPVRQLADALRQPRGGEGAEGLRHRRAATSRRTRRSCGTTGSATSTRTSSSTAASPGACADKVVVVTGASSGIGRATALKLAEAGAQRRARRARRGEAARNEGRRSTGWAARAVMYTADISDLDVVRRARRARADGAGRLRLPRSTTPGARSAAASSTRSTASTISSGRCSSTTSARCG